MHQDEKNLTPVNKQGLLLARSYLSRRFHFIHGLEPALDKLCGAENQRGEGGGEGASSCVLEVTERTEDRPSARVSLRHAPHRENTGMREGLLLHALPI